MSEERRDAAVIQGEDEGGGIAIVKIDTFSAEENIFQKLQQQVVSDGKIEKILEEYKDVESGPQLVMALVHMMMRQVVASPLGHIIPPEAGSSIVKDRIVQAATTILEMLTDKLRQIDEDIERSMREGKEYEVDKNVRKMIVLHQSAMTAIREIMNRYLVLYSMNLPPSMRPPLMQVKLGMEIVR